jgi:hypothetical protein
MNLLNISSAESGLKTPAEEIPGKYIIDEF